MTGTSSARPATSRKNKISSVATPSKSNLAAQEELLSTRHDILKENHETLVKDYKSLEERFKQATELNDLLKWHFDKQTTELEANNRGLLEDCERERSQKEEYKNMVEKIESEREAMIDDLMIKNQELLIAKEKGEEELKEMKTKNDELTEKVAKTESECSLLKSLYDAKNLAGRRRNSVADKNEVIVVNDNLNNTVADAIVISDESDVEYGNPPRKKNIFSRCSNGANSSKVKHRSSSSSSEDDCVLVQPPIKKSRR